jgi:HK97 family phage prohead protease
MRDWKKGDRLECDLSFTPMTKADAPDGYIAGTASTPNTDLYGHKVMAKAFDDSIAKKGLNGPKGIKLLAHHNWTKWLGPIKRLETIGNDLKIEAQLDLDIPDAKTMHIAAKHNGGFNFSVGFTLEEFDFVDEKDAEDGEFLVIHKGDLMEVSVVLFPALPEATMSFIKHVDTTSEFEKALVAAGICRGRREAHLFAQFAKENVHLFEPKMSMPTSEAAPSTQPLLAAHQLRPALDQIAKVKAMLSAR